MTEFATGGYVPADSPPIVLLDNSYVLPRSLPNAAGQPVHREYEKPTTIPCARCGQDVALTWTKSADGFGIFHHACFLAEMEER